MCIIEVGSAPSGGAALTPPPPKSDPSRTINPSVGRVGGGGVWAAGLQGGQERRSSPHQYGETTDNIDRL
jgi:hypothetical protein